MEKKTTCALTYFDQFSLHKLLIKSCYFSKTVYYMYMGSAIFGITLCIYIVKQNNLRNRMSLRDLLMGFGELGGLVEGHRTP